ncbi:MAG: site-specific integrase [Acidobacteria bacterium]|nr:site-specific integrase [Acidobacteriota bacterium]
MAASQPLKDIAVIMYNLGMRPSEVVALRKENIDWQSNKIRIFEGKTDAAKRSLDMPVDVARILRLRYDKTENGLLFGGGKKGKSDTPILKVTNAHNAAVTRSGVEKFKLYDLRHTFASDYVASGNDLVSLAAVLGHSKLDMVYRYAHATEQHQKNSLRNLNSYRGGITDELAKRKTA